MEKTLVVTLLASSDEITEIELLYGGWNLGMLSVQADDLADVIEGLREGFHVVISADKQKQADIQAFVDDLDEEDD